MAGNPAHAVHGGASFEAIGSGFQDLGRIHEVVNADVLDAWYDPAPGVIEALSSHLAWLVKTSPPTHGEGLVEEIARARGVSPENVLVGSGTSSLMYLAFPRLLKPGDRVCVLDPMYGEYRHIFDRVIGVETVLCELDSEESFRPSIDRLTTAARGCQMVVVVNPNSPTGVAVDRPFIDELLRRLDPGTRLWIDETYIGFADHQNANLGRSGYTAESLPALDDRVIVSKSMSKYYALSGLRVGYLVAAKSLVQMLAPSSPPWSVGLLAQVAAVEALRDPSYYRSMTHATSSMRGELERVLHRMEGVDKVYPSVANFLLLRLERPVAAEVVRRCAEHDVYLRNCDSLSDRFQGHFIRVAIKDGRTNVRICEVLRDALSNS
ncbi:MAG: histidinol-phosphate aminotransferase family protein [Fimbriimonadaceae bacterium]|nr:histidinol-phosphate aminotransferase family protein [Fimbriimonadaceae bacterium]QYK55329.1 MAG: histidinol-phosphate aminotransferase family protein [Fimbriimonadaceae bacterium]